MLLMCVPFRLFLVMVLSFLFFFVFVHDFFTNTSYSHVYTWYDVYSNNICWCLLAFVLLAPREQTIWRLEDLYVPDNYQQRYRVCLPTVWYQYQGTVAC